jgi:16S rRNA (adenine1518-N6/adenine1519-N6)-dimethyltransferase
LHKPSVKVIDEQAMFRIIRTSFQQRRKTLKNSLSGIIPADVLGEFFSARGLDTRIRSEQLSLSDFAALADMAATTS